MRFVLQFALPALVFGVILGWALHGRRKARSAEDLEEDPADEIMTTPAFVGVMIAGGLLAVGAMFGVGQLLE
ncbi:MAG: hypothetical protein F4Y01_08870 [Gammaproteobacteria bacterium]|nr:hypothetical protein [Gammaproteobacteria bacterium]